jgi:hypothetical protein
LAFDKSWKKGKIGHWQLDLQGPDGGGLTAAPVEMRVFWDISAEENVILYDVFCEDWTKKNLNIL